MADVIVITFNFCTFNKNVSLITTHYMLCQLINFLGKNISQLTSSSNKDQICHPTFEMTVPKKIDHLTNKKY